MMDIFSSLNHKEILVAVIESISMLLFNLSREDSINYFLSNTALMKFQMMKFSGLDTELAEYYINFLKSVSIRLNVSTVKLFYNNVSEELCRNTPISPWSGRPSSSTTTRSR